LEFFDNSNPTGLPTKRDKYEFKKETINKSLCKVDIGSPYTNLNYRVWFKLMNLQEDKTIQSWVAINAEIWWYSYDIKLKQIAERLILKEGFLLNKSKFKDGNDILIKETDKNFIIVEIFKSFDDQKPPAGLYIRTFSKNNQDKPDQNTKYYKN
jgi:hypothetical protein